MNHEHDAQADVRGHHEAAELDDVVNVGTGNHFGHQRQHAVWRQFHDQTHQLHHPGLQGVDSHQHALAFRLVVFQQLQRRHAEEGGENHHADDRRRAGAGQIGERVFRDERQHHLRHGQIGQFTYVVGLDCRQARAFLRALHQAFGGQAEQVGDQYAHQRRDQRGEQQRADSQDADFAQRRGVMQLGHRAQDRGEHQRHDDHLQQLHIAVADDVEPADGFFQYRVVGAVHQLQAQAEHHADHQADQHFFRQAPLLVAGLRQQQQERDKHQHVNHERKIHPQCLQSSFL
ncbi:Uncharacterised protein [Serratia marcescens]|nr:Uncharacterised protein [Serratia marcescens]